MLRTLKRARRIGLSVHFPYSLRLKMVARIWKYAEIAYRVTSNVRLLFHLISIPLPPNLGNFFAKAFNPLTISQIPHTHPFFQTPHSFQSHSVMQPISWG